MSFNLATMLRESATAYPDKVLLSSADGTATYADVDKASGRFAAGLLTLGLVKGDKVAVQLPNISEFVIAYFGILKAGLSMVPLNPLLTGHEIAYHLNDSDSRLLVTHAGYAEAAEQGAAAAGDVPLYVVGESPAGRPFRELLTGADEREIVPTSSDDTAVLLYTSGTTGKPKGAELTHFQLFMNCTTAGNIFGTSAEDIFIAALPLFHVFGLSSVLNMAVRFGARLVLIPRFDATVVIDAIHTHRATIFSGVPTMYIALLQADITGRDLSTLRAAISGGASIPGEVIRAFEEKYQGTVLLEGYGLSETASTATFNINAERRKVLSIGLPIWGVEAKIVDADGVTLPPGAGHVGEILVRGHNVTKGYYKNPEATAAAIRNGWLHTGDIGYADQDGYLFVVDRIKDLVIRGGYNVYPREVEEVLYTHPAVAEAAVVGRPDDRLGEEVVAYVSVRPGMQTSEKDLIAHTRERLAAYKYPRAVTILPSLPKGPTGKILKRELRT